VTGFREGDAVAVYGCWGCGRCKPCHQGAESLCAHYTELGSRGGGLGRDGGLAEFLLVPDARYLVPLPSWIP
jgi:alcohol dehydrogenase, propanol-preferring